MHTASQPHRLTDIHTYIPRIVVYLWAGCLCAMQPWEQFSYPNYAHLFGHLCFLLVHMVFGLHCRLGGDTGSKLELWLREWRGVLWEILLWHSHVLCFHQCLVCFLHIHRVHDVSEAFSQHRKLPRKTLAFSASRSWVLLLFRRPCWHWRFVW